MTKKSLLIIFLTAVIICALVCAVIILANRGLDSTFGEVGYIEDVLIEYSFDETASLSTNIIVAEFMGEKTFDSGRTELIFAPSAEYKGKLSTSNEIYALPYGNIYTEGDYEVGETYLLLLQRFSSVYSNYDTYCILYNDIICFSDPDWEQQLNAVSYTVATTDDTSPTYSIHEYTLSDNVSEIIETADSIFTVYVDSVLSTSEVRDTTSYQCSVTGTFRGTPTNNGNIIVTFFNGTVEEGREYIVFLNSISETSKVYTLAARTGVFSMEDAESAGLSGLMKEFRKYDAVVNEAECLDEFTDEPT